MLRILGMLIGIGLMLAIPIAVIFAGLNGSNVRGKHIAGMLILT